MFSLHHYRVLSTFGTNGTTYRFFTVLRLALPRTSIRDVTYEGIVIPKGTVFFLNAWACNMGKPDHLFVPLLQYMDRNPKAYLTFTDPDVWTDPDEFRPERWLEQPDAPLFTYGMGYRMCAGSLLANRELYLVFIRTLNSFRIEPHDKTDCHPLRGNSDPTSLVAIPQKYKVRFVPKNKQALSKALAH
jgi:3-hydroxyphenylacetate 6-hydroxylase